MKLTKVNLKGPDCVGSRCPAIYKSDRGSYIIQGEILSSENLKKIENDSSMTAVEIPASLLAALKDL